MRWLRKLLSLLAVKPTCVCGHKLIFHDERGCLWQDMMTGKFCPCREPHV